MLLRSQHISRMIPIILHPLRRVSVCKTPAQLLRRQARERSQRLRYLPLSTSRGTMPTLHKKADSETSTNDHLGLHADIKLLHTGGQPGHNLMGRQVNEHTPSDRPRFEGDRKERIGNERLRRGCVAIEWRAYGCIWWPVKARKLTNLARERQPTRAQQMGHPPRQVKSGQSESGTAFSRGKGLNKRWSANVR